VGPPKESGPDADNAEAQPTNTSRDQTAGNADTTGPHRPQPSIPNVAGADTLTAALAYAACGWYILPTDPAVDIKHPGSVVGKRWHGKSSRDPKQIAAWFAGTSASETGGLPLGGCGDSPTGREFPSDKVYRRDDRWVVGVESLSA
jgi:hypothetical protein